MQLALRLIPLLASYASLYGLYFTVIPPGDTRSSWHLALLIFSIFVCVATLTIEVSTYLKKRPKTFATPEEIQLYMLKWISSGGRAAIFSRDLSWAESNREVKNLLTTKALHRELIIMVEHETELTRELKKNGASVYYYGDIGFVPMSRFTIVDFERLDARVAIGVRNDGLHSIKEHDAASSVEYYLANDLVRMIIERNAKNVSINTAAKSI